MTPEQFIKIRKDAGLSLAQLSEIIRVHTRTIRRYEDGSVPISGPVSALMEIIERHSKWIPKVYKYEDFEKPIRDSRT